VNEIEQEKKQISLYSLSSYSESESLILVQIMWNWYNINKN